MESSKRFFNPNRQKNLRADSASSQKNPQKPRRLILRNPKHRVSVIEGYLEIESDEGVFLAGFKQFDSIYLHKELALEISAIFEISCHMRVYLIDMHGNLLGRFKRFRLEER